MNPNTNAEPTSSDHDIKISLSKGLGTFFPRQAQRYSAATTILLYWAEDDMGIAHEIEALRDLFQDTMRYVTEVFKIPSEEPLETLKDYLEMLFTSFGRDKDNLIVLYYGGHGQRTAEEFKDKGTCIWAAKGIPKPGERDPTLDWFEIQPSLSWAKCDIVVLLDCCYAGQAVRTRHSQRIEYLCATDRDRVTAVGIAKWPSFTKAMANEIRRSLDQDGEFTLPALHRRLGEAKSGLLAQPHYANLSQGSIGRPPICLRKFAAPGEGTRTNITPATMRHEVCLKLSLLNIINKDTMVSLMNWLTKDSPSSLSNIQLVDQVLDDAQDTSELGDKLLSETEGAIVPSLSPSGQKEAARLLDGLKTSLARILSSPMSDAGAKDSIYDVRQRCSDITTFIEDSMSSLGSDTLQKLDSVSVVDRLHDRIQTDLRKSLLTKDEDFSGNMIRVFYDAGSPPENRFRSGRRAGEPVLVEYVNYESRQEPWALIQVKRMTALHAVPKSPEFCSLSSIGFLHESVPQARFGIVYKLPRQFEERPFRQLSQLINRKNFAPLESRVLLGSLLCGALVKLHSIGWYHKSIRAENVLIFATNKNSTVWNWASPYLVGFDCSRPFEAETRNTVDYRMENNIYRHPERWGKSATFRSYHDLYALGILLIELSTWKVIPGTEEAPFKSMRDPEEVRQYLLTFIKEKVSHAVGTILANAITTCLQRRDWDAYEEWQVQGIVRREVLAPLKEVASRLRKDALG